MSTSQFRTKVQLRFDDLSAWNTFNPLLMKGELAAIQDGPDSIKIKIGDGKRHFNDLPWVTNGLSETKHYQVEIDLSTEYVVSALFAQEFPESIAQNDDIFIVKQKFGKDDSPKFQFTGYVYDSLLSAWMAMDGNYSADNVYFKNDITLAGNYDKVGNISLSDGTLSATGKSVSDLMTAIFTKELQPSVSNPAISLTVGSNVEGEVGSKYYVPSATLKVTSVGTYSYGPETGIVVQEGNAVVKCTTEGTSAINDSELGLNGTVILPTGNKYVFEDATTKTYSYSASATHTAGSIPLTNLGNPDESKKIQAGTLTKSGTAKATGYWKSFYGYRTGTTQFEDPSTLTSDEIRDLGHAVKGKLVTVNSFETTNAKQMIFASLKGLNSSVSVKNSQTGAPFGNIKGPVDVIVKDAGGTDRTYSLWYYNNSSEDSGSNIYKIEIV